ncbi:hypothetical protein SKAU_G00112740 [Synaphobranchus kaupii]|uniref:Uncharacterized protein n=1 Tax=Synaphobranchus kaupii TaxID=118154 RepID=A0A9Q1G0T7_SYNKA|nr:hypothetical protein SKAU_G00112740 [Synaphobranchus kaupii]
MRTTAAILCQSADWTSCESADCESSGRPPQSAVEPRHTQLRMAGITWLTALLWTSPARSEPEWTARTQLHCSLSPGLPALTHTPFRERLETGATPPNPPASSPSSLLLNHKHAT